MKFACMLLPLALAALTGAGTVEATTLEYDYSAIVSYDTLDPALGAPSLVNQVVTGFFDINPQALGSTAYYVAGQSESYTGASNSPGSQVFHMSLNLNSGTFTTADLTTGYNVVGGSLNPVSGYSFYGQQGNATKTSEIDFGPISTLTPGALPLISNGYLVNPDYAIAQNSSSFPTAYGFVTQTIGSGTGMVDFTFTSIELVPLPDTLPLFAVGASLLSLMRRRRAA